MIISLAEDHHMFFSNNHGTKESDSGVTALVNGNNAFAIDLYQHLRTVENNLFFSPYSISSALAMTYGGAKGNTFVQMAQALHFELEEKNLHAEFKHLRELLDESTGETKNQLMVANALWPQEDYRLRRSYLNLLRKFYGARVTRVDFREDEIAREKINTWVAEKTAEKICELISPGVLDSLTRLVLVNAIYFKGAWEEPFSADQTTEGLFHPTVEEEIPVQMMHQKSLFSYYEDDHLQLLELPYAGGNLSMVVLLPKEISGITGLEDSLTPDRLASWTAGLTETEVNVALPKFELSFPFRLDESLQSMGMTDAFTGQADFSGMEESRELYLGAVLHKAFVSVNEEGTEAAAATAVILQTKSVSFMSVDFIADHPFIFLIRDNRTGSILFLGRVVRPEQG